MAAAVAEVAGVLDEGAVLDAVGRAVAEASCLFDVARRRGVVVFCLNALGGGRGGGVVAWEAVRGRDRGDVADQDRGGL